MISLHPTGSPAETNAAYTLLAIIADPDAAKKRLDDLVAEKKAAHEAANNAKASAEEAKSHHDGAAAKLAEAKRISGEFDRNHEARTQSLDDRHKTLVGTDERLKKFEAQTAAYEKEMVQTITAREDAVKIREADVGKREVALRLDETAAQELKETYQRKVDAFRAMQEELKK